MFTNRKEWSQCKYYRADRSQHIEIRPKQIKKKTNKVNQSCVKCTPPDYENKLCKTREISAWFVFDGQWNPLHFKICHSFGAMKKMTTDERTGGRTDGTDVAWEHYETPISIPERTHCRTKKNTNSKEVTVLSAKERKNGSTPPLQCGGGRT